MFNPLYRNVFTWPSQAWTHRDKDGFIKAGSFDAEDLGLELTDIDHETMIRQLINQAKIEDKDESFSLFDMGKTVTKYKTWKECFPRIRPFFAIKSHDDPCVISLLHYLGAGFDCASKVEIELAVNRLRVNPGSVVYANTVKPKSHMTYAKSLGVDLMTFDNEEELYKIKQCYPNARLLLRLCPEVSKFVDIAFSSKFGCSDKLVPKLCRVCKDLGLNLVGICFNVGSGCRDADPYIINIREARLAFDFAKDAGFEPHILDIGGGFNGDDDGEDNLRQMSVSINEVLDDLFPATSGVMIMAEPGRYFVESSLMLATCVIGKRIQETPQGKVHVNGYVDSEPASFEYYLSDSHWGMFSAHQRLKYRQAPIVMSKRQQDDVKYMSILWGQSCDVGDKIDAGCALPELDIGDWLIYTNLGRYSVSVHTEFNGFRLQPIRRIMTRTVWDTLFQP